MEKTLGDTLKESGFLNDSQIDAYTQEASKLQIQLSLRDDINNPISPYFSRTLNTLKRLTNSEEEGDKVLQLLSDLAFFSFTRFEFQGKTLAIFDPKTYTNAVYKVFLSHNVQDILKLIPQELYFDKETTILQKIFLLSHIKFYSVKYVESLHKDALFDEVYKSPYLREFLFYAEVKTKRKFFYDLSIVSFAAALQHKFPTAFEFLVHLTAYLGVQAKMVSKGEFSKKEEEAKKKTRIIKRTLEFLSNVKKMVHLLATKEGSDSKFNHLSSCLNFAAQIVGSMHKKDPLKESRQAFLSKFVNFSEAASTQIQIFTPDNEVTVSFFDPLEFDTELENVIKKIQNPGSYEIRTRSKSGSWAAPKPFLIIPKPSQESRLEDYLNSGGVDYNLYKEHRLLLLDEKHPLKPRMDEIFKKRRVIASLKSLEESGFAIAEEQQNAITTLTHPGLKGYYLDVIMDGYIGCSEKTRFLSAIQTLGYLKKWIIDEKAEAYFTTPKAWVYLLPENPEAPWWIEGDRKLFVLLRESLNVLSPVKTLEKWKELKDEELLGQVIKFALKTGLKLKPKLLRFKKDGKIALSPYSTINPEEDRFSYFLKKIHPDMIPFCQKIIDGS